MRPNGTTSHAISLGKAFLARTTVLLRSSVNPVIVAKKPVSYLHVLTIDLVITLVHSITMGAKRLFTARFTQI